MVGLSSSHLAGGNTAQRQMGRQKQAPACAGPLEGTVDVQLLTWGVWDKAAAPGQFLEEQALG